jgi:hypothetical protein
MSDLSKDERQLIRGLEALAAGAGAPPVLKARLLREYRRTHRRQPFRWLAAAAGIASLAVLLSRPTPQAEGPAPPDLSAFVRLDDEPVSAGIVVRVKLPVQDETVSGEVEADVLLGDDGRAHAVRFVK